jgi:phage-related protein
MASGGIASALLFFLFLAIVGLIVFLVIYVVPNFSSISNSVIVFVSDAVIGAENIASTIISDVTSTVNGIQTFVASLAGLISAGIANGAKIVQDALTAIGTTILNALTDIYNSLKDVAQSLQNTIFNFYAVYVGPIQLQVNQAVNNINAIINSFQQLISFLISAL